MTGTSIDFDGIRAAARFEPVLVHYGLEVGGRGAERMIRCPFHDDRSPSCAVNLEKKVFHCFACGENGTILDFVANMESCPIIEAAELLADWCRVSPGSSMQASTAPLRATGKSRNAPLRFALPLDPGHPYFAARGVSRCTVSHFGLGYCEKGIMAGRICIPIHDAGGHLIAYAGRWPDAHPPPGEPRYRFPRGFRKRDVLFNAHRVTGATQVVLVEGFWSVFRLDALGVPAVALMGCSLSDHQAGILRKSGAERITILLDGDAAGRSATRDILPRLARHHHVHAPDLPDDAEPDTLDEDQLMALIHQAHKA